MVAKATVSGPSFTPAEMADPVPPVVLQRYMIGLDTQLRLEAERSTADGGVLSQSSESQVTNIDKAGVAHPTVVPETENDSHAAPVTEIAANSADGPTHATETEFVEEPVVDYTNWTVPELQAELSKRDLLTTGKKPTLVSRLQEDDAAEESSDDDVDVEYDDEDDF